MRKNTKQHRFLLQMLLFSLIRRRSRIIVALIGITLGATVLLGMITLCFDIPRQMSKEFRSYGANMLLMPAGDIATLPQATIARVTATLPAEKRIGVTPFRYYTVRNEIQPYTMVGTDFAQVQLTSPYWQVEGRWPMQAGEILIGADVAEFSKWKIGSEVMLSGKNEEQNSFEQEFHVAGIVKTGRSEDSMIFTDLAFLAGLLEEAPQAEVVEVSITATAEELKEWMSALAQTEPTVEPHLVKWVTNSETSVLTKLTTLVYLVTLVVLLLTMICVATTMMTVVMERRKEIGLKKALGAENQQIAREFLAEGMILGFIGGMLGSVGGLLFAQLISQQVFGRAMSATLYLIPLTVLVSMLVTMLACFIPVRRAVEVEPALVLRGE